MLFTKESKKIDINQSLLTPTSIKISPNQQTLINFLLIENNFNLIKIIYRDIKFSKFEDYKFYYNYLLKLDIIYP